MLTNLLSELPFVQAIPTILQNGSVALSGINGTVLMNEDLSYVMANFTDLVSVETIQPLVPYQDTLLLLFSPRMPRDNTSQAYDLDIATGGLGSISQKLIGNLRNIMVYQDPSGGADVMVMVRDFDGTVTTTIGWEGAVRGYSQIQTNPDVDPYMVDDVLFLFWKDQNFISSMNLVSQMKGCNNLLQ